MANVRDLESLFLEMVEQDPDCDVDEVVSHCHQAIWGRVFLTLKGLIRSGQVTLRQQRSGRYKVGLATHMSADHRISTQHYA